ncbi:MAG TPA: hypothetical protein VFR70_02505 [Flavobacterium sp.]|nr:hypothetical protein [Flavobacterium sp.]
MKELEDSPHFPAWLRNFQTEFIGFVVVHFRIYSAFVDYLRLQRLPKLPMADHGSGSGEPAVHIFKESGCFSKLTLNDKFPNSNFKNAENITYCQTPVDVLDLAFRSGICYTLFNVFHHFDVREKLKLVSSVKEAGAHGFFVEILEPTLLCLLKVLLMTTAGTLLLTPFLRPFSFRRLLFTYIFPINVFTIVYDGTISVFKSTSLSSYQKLFAHFGDVVRVRKLKKGLGSLIVIHIQPK